jgi:hypothetical protein
MKPSSGAPGWRAGESYTHLPCYVALARERVHRRAGSPHPDGMGVVRALDALTRRCEAG